MIKNKHIIRTLSLGVFCSLFAMGCEPDPVVPTTTVASADELSTHHVMPKIDASGKTSDGWIAVMVSEQTMHSRNPFRGFSDTIMAENLRRMRVKQEQMNPDTLLPEQIYPTRDYKVISVITGTADPKVYVIDPSGNRFVLRRGSLIGNNNGSISSIRRSGIEVYERVADKGQYIELPLFENSEERLKKIQFSIQ